jgi:dolichol-phosphate mannosyltransferase/undecaprenyl-phosphate 4-deoxy-4-formamido-L-arabinose transferase
VQVFEETLRVAFEIILVDDASPNPDTWPVLDRISAGEERVHAYQLMRNAGQHTALITGLAQTRGEFVITLDDDLQHLPEEVPKLVNMMDESPELDVVIGAYISKQHSWFRNLGTKVINLITNHIFSKKSDLELTSFRLMRRPVVDALLKTHYKKPRIGLILLQVTDRIGNVPVQHDERRDGKSGYSLRRLFSDLLDNVLGTSALPLQLVSYLGFGCSGLSLLLVLYFFVKYLRGDIGVPGWTSIILLLLFFFGVLLLCFGIVGEYLIRIMREVQGAPGPIVRKKKL